MSDSIYKIMNNIDDEESLEITAGSINSPFANNIDRDIVDSIDTPYDSPVTNNNIKCSKSVVANALYYVSKGESVEFCLGNIQLPSKQITHCWIEHNDKVAQTHVPSADVKLIKKFSTMLVANDVNASREKILQLIKLVNRI